MASVARRHLSPLLALALLAALLAVSPFSDAASNYGNAERISVSNFTTAGISISKRVFPDSADAAVLTRDDHFPDVLAGSALAAKVNGPVLFTDTDVLTSATATELDRILDGGDTVYVAGGPVAVSDAVVDELRDRGYQVTRLAGLTRVETAIEVAKMVGLTDSGRVLIARAFGPAGKDRTVGWVDSVTCGAYANHTQTPVLLTHTDALDASTADAIEQLGATSATICGGPAAVSNDVATQLRDSGLTVTRVAGETRVETAVAVAEQLFGHDSAPGKTYLLVNGYGENFGWGLAATPLAGALEAPILLVGTDQPTSCADDSQQARATICHLETVGDGQADLVVVGSGAQVNDAVFEAAAKAAGGQTVPDPDEPLGAPTAVTTRNVSTADEGRVEVSWDAVDDPDGRLAGYNVYYGTGSPDTRAGSSTPTVGPETTTFTVGALQLGTEYQFAVTSVTEVGAESEPSAAASETTTAPMANLTSPSAGTPIRVEPASGLTVEFRYSASEGGTFQLFHRATGGDGWKAFGETPSSNPPTVAAGEDATKSVNVTAPSPEQATDYDLRFVLTPKGSESMVDVEIGALHVNDPKVLIQQPTQSSKTEVLPGTEGAEVVFDYDTTSDGTYDIALRGTDPGAENPWTTVADGEAPAGDVSGVSVTFSAPTAEGFYDLRVQVDRAAEEIPDTDIEIGALHVVDPEITLIQPAGPSLVAPGVDPGIEFQTNAGGHYQVQHRLAGATGWTLFDSEASQAEGSTGVGGAPQVSPAVEAPGDVGSYDVSVLFDPNADSGNAIRSTAHEDEASPARIDVAALVLTQPNSTSNRVVVDPEEQSTFPVSFDIDTPVAVDYQIEIQPVAAQERWQILGSPGSQAPTDGPTTITDDVPVPEAGEYDVRVRLTPQAGDGEITHGHANALEVLPPADGVRFVTPHSGNPAEVEGDDTFSVTFNSDLLGTYTIECTGANAAACDEPLAQGDVAQAGADQDVTGISAPPRVSHDPASNVYDLKITVQPDAGDAVTDEESGALRVADVEVVAPPSSGNTYGEGQQFTVDFHVSTSGDYVVQVADDPGTNWEMMDAPGGSADGQVSLSQADSGTQGQDVLAPSTPGDYKLRVKFTAEPSLPEVFSGDVMFEVTSGDAGVTVTEPEVDPDPASPNTPITVTFIADGYDAASPSDYPEYILEWKKVSDDAYQTFDGDPGGTGVVLAPPGASFSTAVTAPSDTTDYDIRVSLDADADNQFDDAENVGTFRVRDETPSPPAGAMTVTLGKPDGTDGCVPLEPSDLIVDHAVTYGYCVGVKQTGGENTDAQVLLTMSYTNIGPDFPMECSGTADLQDVGYVHPADGVRRCTTMVDTASVGDQEQGVLLPPDAPSPPAPDRITVPQDDSLRLLMDWQYPDSGSTTNHLFTVSVTLVDPDSCETAGADCEALPNANTSTATIAVRCTSSGTQCSTA